MCRLVPAILCAALTALTLAPLPAAAGWGAFELPRLDFATAPVPATRGCAEPARPGPAVCLPAK